MIKKTRNFQNIYLKKVEIHKFEFEGTIIALEVCNNCVHHLNPIMSDILDIEGELNSRTIKTKLRNKYPLDQIEESIQLLLAKKLLIHADTVLPDQTSLDDSFSLKGLELNVSENCNFRCRYCTVGQDSSELKLVMMSPKTAIAAIDFLIRESKDCEEVFIRFNGGEPLLNFDTIEIAVLHAKRMGARYRKKIGLQLLTNGSILDNKIASFIKKHKIQPQISIDGPQRVHDYWRVTKSGKGTHSRIIANISSLLSSCAQHMIGRATLTSISTGYREVFDYLIDLGFRYVVVEPVFYKGGDEFGFEDQDILKLKEEYNSIAQVAYSEGLQRKYIHISPFLSYITNLCRQSARSFYCGAAKHFLGVSGSGEVYPCSELARQKDLCFGTVYQGINPYRIDHFLDLVSVNNKPLCSHCWARYICGGGCYAMARKFTGEITDTLPYFCDLMKKRVELSMWLYHKFLAEKPEVFYDLIDKKTRYSWSRILGEVEA